MNKEWKFEDHVFGRMLEAGQYFYGVVEGVSIVWQMCKLLEEQREGATIISAT